MIAPQRPEYTAMGSGGVNQKEMGVHGKLWDQSEAEVELGTQTDARHPHGVDVLTRSQLKTIALVHMALEANDDGLYKQFTEITEGSGLHLHW